MKIRFKFGVSWLRKFGIGAITLYPWVVFADSWKEVDPRIVRHELEHCYQVERLGYFRFYVSYFLFYLANRLKGQSHWDAYWDIPFEQEARLSEFAVMTLEEAALFVSYKS